MHIFKNILILFIICSLSWFLSINSQIVEIRLIPEILNVRKVVIHIPLFIIMLILMGTGLFLGIVLEYLRAHKDRKLAKNNLIQAERLNMENKYLRSSVTSETEEILSLLK